MSSLRNQLASTIAFLMTIPLIVVPIELGWLLYVGFRKHGRFKLDGVVLFRESLSWRSYLVLISVVFASMIGGFILGSTFIVVALVATFIS